MTSLPDVSQFLQRCQDLLASAEEESFESKLNSMRTEVMNNNAAVIEQLRKDLAAELEAALNVKGVEKAELSLGCALALSESRNDNFEAVKILQNMVDQNSPQLDCCYFWIAVARFHLGEFREARIWCERLLLRHPDSILSRRLLGRIRVRVMRDGFSGLGIVVAVAVFSAIVGSMFGRIRSS